MLLNFHVKCSKDEISFTVCSLNVLLKVLDVKVLMMFNFRPKIVTSWIIGPINVRLCTTGYMKHTLFINSTGKNNIKIDLNYIYSKVVWRLKRASVSCRQIRYLLASCLRSTYIKRSKVTIEVVSTFAVGSKRGKTTAAPILMLGAKIRWVISRVNGQHHATAPLPQLQSRHLP